MTLQATKEKKLKDAAKGSRLLQTFFSPSSSSSNENTSSNKRPRIAGSATEVEEIRAVVRVPLIRLNKQLLSSSSSSTTNEKASSNKRQHSANEDENVEENGAVTLSSSSPSLSPSLSPLWKTRQTTMSTLVSNSSSSNFLLGLSSVTTTSVENCPNYESCVDANCPYLHECKCLNFHRGGFFLPMQQFPTNKDGTIRRKGCKQQQAWASKVSFPFPPSSFPNQL